MSPLAAALDAETDLTRPAALVEVPTGELAEGVDAYAYRLGLGVDLDGAPLAADVRRTLALAGLAAGSTVTARIAAELPGLLAAALDAGASPQVVADALGLPPGTAPAVAARLLETGGWPVSAVATRDPRVHRAAVALLCVVAAGALALSFTGLALLGALAGFGALAPVFAVVVDAGTGAATLYWLTGSPSSRRTRYARRLGLTLLAVSLVGNAAAHGLAAHGVPVEGLAAGLVLTMPWWAAVAVGATPPVIFAGVVHLLAMADDVPVVSVEAVPVGPVSLAGPAPVGPAVLDIEPTAVPAPRDEPVAAGTPSVEPVSPPSGGAGDAGQDAAEAAVTPSDEDLTAVVRAWAVDEGATPSRERIRVRFAIGSGRADRVRAAALTGQDREVSV